MNAMNSILFVDDESRLLDGLRRTLRSLRHQWDMEFALGGQEALAALQRRPFDVIVSDMRMPGIDGAQLLRIVEQKHPRTVRLALSGQTSKQTILESVGPIHQYLPKPCDAPTLRDTIARACSLREFLTDKKLQGLISQLDFLPCLASAYSELILELQSDEARTDKVAQIISRDVGMSAKTMQLVNSAFFGVRTHVADVAHAVTLLGLDTIKALVLSINIFGQFDDQAAPSIIPLGALWEHSWTVGQYARLIAENAGLDRQTADHAMMAGLLHDVGMTILAAKMPQDYQDALARVKDSGLSIVAAEHDVIGATHAEVGAYLLGLWGFPDATIEAVTYHHCPGKANCQELSILTAVHTANCLTNQIHPTDNRLGSTAAPDTDYLEKLGLAEELAVWRQACLNGAQVNNQAPQEQDACIAPAG